MGRLGLLSVFVDAHCARHAYAIFKQAAWILSQLAGNTCRAACYEVFFATKVKNSSSSARVITYFSFKRINKGNFAGSRP